MAADVLAPFRIVLVPGLHNSGPDHWQSRWQRLYPACARVEQADWDDPQLPQWSARLDQLRHAQRKPVLLVAHSFGCLTAVHSCARDPRGVAGLLLVAPADPDKFRVAELLPEHELNCPSIMIGSTNDPWMRASQARLWAARWGSRFVDGGALGHINTESNLGDWAFGQAHLAALARLAGAAARHSASKVFA